MALSPSLHHVVLSTLRLGLGDVSTAGLASSTYDIMLGDNSRCPGNCSGHGACQDGQCLCLVQFSGGTCHEVNIGYYIAFGTIFVLLGCVAFVQLVLCMVYEYSKEDKRSWRRACQLTVQKLLYLLIICATAIRGTYFFTRWQVSEAVASNLWSAYFPVIISGFSLIVCFWAEAFHISSAPSGERLFLSKSTIAFIVFNVLQYLLLAAQLLFSEMILEKQEEKILAQRLCNGGFAALMIIVVIFFLAYGVEVYFKVHGAFRVSESGLDTWQLHMSRLGLVAQAVLQLITALFLVSDVASDWKYNLPVLSQNFYDIGFRIVEFGVALWFPCVLWNCGCPEELWVLNPKRIFRSFDFRRRRQQFEKEGKPVVTSSAADLHYNTFDSESSSVKFDCWICYDPERKDAGCLIQPCLCKGDVATVHHDCLKKWLVESAANEGNPECRVCGERYKLEAHYWMPKGLRPRHWLQTFLALLFMFGSPFAAYAVTHSIAPASYVRILVIGTTVVLELVSLRLFVIHVRSAFTRAKVATMKISGKVIRSKSSPNLPSQRSSRAVPNRSGANTVNSSMEASGESLDVSNYSGTNTVNSSREASGERLDVSNYSGPNTVNSSMEASGESLDVSKYSGANTINSSLEKSGESFAPDIVPKPTSSILGEKLPVSQIRLPISVP